MDIGYAGALVGGVLTLLSPCSAMLLPAFFAYAFTSPKALVARTGVFYLGLVTMLVPLGALSGSLGALLMQQRSIFVLVASSAVIALGLVQISGLRMPAFSRGSGAEGVGIVSVFLLGTVYGVAGVCAGPILGSVLTVAALGGNPLYGGVLLAIYAAGMTVPLLVLALFWDRLGVGKRWLRPHELRIGRWRNSWLMIAAGLLSIGIGLLLLLTDGTAGLGGILGVGDQFALESGTLQATSGVSNLLFGGIAVTVIALVAVLFLIRRRRHRTTEPN